jgi:hypothetical protein
MRPPKIRPNVHTPKLHKNALPYTYGSKAVQTLVQLKLKPQTQMKLK